MKNLVHPLPLVAKRKNISVGSDPEITSQKRDDAAGKSKKERERERERERDERERERERERESERESERERVCV